MLDIFMRLIKSVVEKKKLGLIKLYNVGAQSRKIPFAK